MITSETILFNHTPLSEIFRRREADVDKELNSIPKEQFLVNSDEDIFDFLNSKMEIVPLRIYRENITRSDPKEIRINRPGDFDHFYREIQYTGVSLELSIPYTGKSDLWKIQPSIYTTNPPRGDIYRQGSNDLSGTLCLKMQYTQPEFQPNIVNNEIEGNLNIIDKYLGLIKQEIEAHNPQFQNEIRRQVVQRRERLGVIQDVTKTLNIPLQIREGLPNLSEIPLQKKIIKPLSTSLNSPQEYGIGEQNYEDIINIIRHIGGTFERTPETYSVHGEEDLRNILLASLNGYYKNLATGEAFRKKGKTDICIEFENRAAFIAECKLWNGDQKLLEAVDQVLSYLTWRDGKTSLIIFNKSVAGFLKVQEKIRIILDKHLNYIREETIRADREWRMVFRSKDDPDRKITMHIFLFDLFVLQ